MRANMLAIKLYSINEKTGQLKNDPLSPQCVPLLQFPNQYRQ